MWGFSECVKRYFSVGCGPRLDSMSPARSWRSASHAAGSHDWLSKNWGPERQDKVDTICNGCGTPTTHMLYPFGAASYLYLLHQQLDNNNK